MQKYAKVVNEEIGACIVGLGDDVEYYESQGMTLMDVEQATDGGWYLAGKVPAPSAEYQARQLYAKLKAGLELKSIFTSIPLKDDATALALAPVCPEWQAETHYEAGEIINHKDVPYRVVQPVDSLEHQPPDAVGMLAIYRPIDPASGTIDEPKKFIYGTDVQNGLYYTYEGKLYLAKADIPNCTYYPGQEGVWQWEEVTNEPEGSGSGQ